MFGSYAVLEIHMPLGAYERRLFASRGQLLATFGSLFIFQHYV